MGVLMRVEVDGTLCTGHGRCWTLAGDVYDADDEGFNNAAGTVIDVPPGLEESAMRGLRNCPEGAIRVVDES
jgi:ferredoxin